MAIFIIGWIWAYTIIQFIGLRPFQDILFWVCFLPVMISVSLIVRRINKTQGAIR